jgi:hypothetical protein
VDILIRRADLDRMKAALTPAGFVYHYSAKLDFFLDGPNAKARDAVHVVFAGEKVRPEETLANPDVDESEQAEHYRVLSLEPLVRVKLTAFRIKDRMHLIDMLELGIIDQTWCGRLPPELAQRLQGLIDNPDSKT